MCGDEVLLFDSLFVAPTEANTVSQINHVYTLISLELLRQELLCRLQHEFKRPAHTRFGQSC